MVNDVIKNMSGHQNNLKIEENIEEYPSIQNSIMNPL